MVLYCAAIPGIVFLGMQREWDATDGLVVSLVLWCALSLAWSPDPLAGLIEVQKVSSLGVVFLALRRLPANWTGVGLSVGASLALVLFFQSFPEGGFRNENLHTEYLLVAIPPLIALRRLWAWALIPFVPVVLLTANDSRLEFVVLAAFVVAGLVWWARKDGRKLAVVVASLTMLVVFALAIVPELVWLQVLDRVHLASGTAMMWAENPIIGNGVGSFDHLWPRFADSDLRLFPGLDYMGAQDGNVFPGQAHNDFLETLAEMGLVGFALFAAIVLWRIKANKTAVSMLGILGVLALIEFPLQNAGTAMLGAMALATMSPVRSEFRLPALSAFAFAPLIVLAAFSVSLGIKAAQANTLFAYTKSYVETEAYLADAFLTNLSAYRTFPNEPRIRLQLFRTLTAAFLAGKIEVSIGAAEEIFAISKTAIPEDRGLLIARIGFLTAAGMCAPECDQVFATLKRNESRLNLLGRIREMIDVGTDRARA